MDVIAREQKLTKMLTLTLDPKRLPEGEPSDEYIRERWRRLRVLLARKVGKSVDFFSTLEFQEETGMAHLHVLLTQYIEWAWVKQKWQSVGGGEHVDIRHVDVHRVVAYLSKYLTGEKVTHTLQFLPKRARIFTTSRSIILWGKKKVSGWWLRRMGIGELWDAMEMPSRVKSVPIDELKGFPLEMLSYFEGVPIQEALGNRNVIKVLKAAISVWKAGTS
jgi:hypothetical protein